MGMTDPIADMLTRIRNASRIRVKHVDVMMSQLNLNIVKTLKKTGYVNGYDVKKNVRGHECLRVYLKYPEPRRAAISDIQRYSRPGRRVYVPCDRIPRVLSGYGVTVLSTSRGIMTDREAKALHIGGEVLCKVW